MLKKIERKILYELSKDARLPVTLLAKRSGVSRRAAEYALGKLSQQGLKSLAIIDTESLGFTRHELYVRVAGVSDEVVRYLVHHPMVLWVRTGLNEDIIAEFFAVDVVEQEQFVRKIKTSFPQVQRVQCIAIVRERSFPLRALGYGGHIVSTTVSRKKSIDENDVRLLARLSVDARTTCTELSRRIGLSADAIANRIRALRAAGIIKGYRVAVSDDVLDLERYKLLLKLGSNRRDYELVLSYLASAAVTEYLKSSVGNWDVSVTLLTKDTKSLAEFIWALQRKFGDSLKEYEVILLFGEHKNSYFPEGVQKRLVAISQRTFKRS